MIAVYKNIRPAETKQKSLKYRPDIDGLRSIAIISVVLFHANLPLFKGGFVGVDVFFVISGFLIGSLVFTEMREQTFTLKCFYERRAKRILPALFAVVAVCLLPACVLLSGSELIEFGKEILATLTSSSNFYFAANSDYFTGGSEVRPLLMTWSLGVEEQFYVLLPLVMFALIRYVRRYLLHALILLSSLSFLTAVFALTIYPKQAFYLLPTRAWELGLGTILGIYEALHRFEKRNSKIAGLQNLVATAGVALLAYSIFAFNRGTLFPGPWTLVPVSAALMLIWARESWFNSAILAAKPFASIGLVSYSWYLWHWPLISFARITMAGVLPLWVGLAMVLLSLLLAVISYRYVEQPFRKPVTPDSPLLVRYAAVTVLLCLPAGLLVAVHGWASRYSEAKKIDIANSQSEEDPCMVRYRKSGLNRSNLCLGNQTLLPILAVMGDSHAAAMGPYLRSEAQSHSWQVHDLTKASYPPLSEFAPSDPSRRNHVAECTIFNSSALQAVVSNPNVRTVLLAGYWTALFPEQDAGTRFIRPGQSPSAVTEAESWNNLKEGLSKTAIILRASGKRVLIALDVPRFPFDPVLAARTNAIPIRTALNSLLGGPTFVSGVQSELDREARLDQQANAIIFDVARKTGIVVLDLQKQMCIGSECRFETNNTPLYIDSQHLSVAGASYALRGVSLFQ